MTDEEKFSKMKAKLENFIDSHEGNAASFSKYLLESKLLEGDNLDSSELKDLMNIGKNVKLDMDEKSELLAKRNLIEIEALSGVHVKSCDAKIVKIVDGSNQCNKEWKVKILPDKANFPEVVLHQNFTSFETPATGEMPEITKLAVDIEGVEVDSDLEEAIRYCEDNLEPQMLTRLIQEYMPLSQDRQGIYSTSTSNRHCNLSNSGNRMEFTNSVGSILANVCLIIKLDKRSLTWTPSWMCKLTDFGFTACSSLHLPSELIKTGTVASWDWYKAVDTLGKVARLDADTPARGGVSARPWDVSNLETDTPLKGEEVNKRVPKRKLN